jgi:DmsE family decaheme c-type cytochrome
VRHLPRHREVGNRAMTTRPGILLLALAFALPAGAAPNHKLKPGANGKLCLECHGDFEAKLKQASVHTPVKARDCTGCHNPHASDHGKLLSAKPLEVCSGCHDVLPKGAKSAHKPVIENRCRDCHDPHASPNKFVLLKPGNELCAGCHKAIAEVATKARYRHKPVEQGCVVCHLPHGSAKAADLLKNEVPGLCVGCHKTDGAIFMKQHMNYPVGKSRCTSCHDPHGSNARGMLYDTVHPPVAKGMCSMCHEPPTSPNRFKTRQVGASLCRGCHAQKFTQMYEKNRIHHPVAEGACLACHTPHASPKKGLVKGNMVGVCGSCHADTIRRQDVSVTKHVPIRDGNCTACHDPHSSNASLMFANPNGIEMCGSCHEWQKHSSHPIGATKKDPRNKNLTLDCLSCHRAHGTEYAHMMPFTKTSDLCTKCHETFQR